MCERSMIPIGRNRGVGRTRVRQNVRLTSSLESSSSSSSHRNELWSLRIPRPSLMPLDTHTHKFVSVSNGWSFHGTYEITASSFIFSFSRLSRSFS